MNKDKELLKQIKEQYARELHYSSWRFMPESVNIVPRDVSVIAERYAALRMKPLIQCIQKLADWNEKYPPGRLYGAEMAATLERELTAIVNEGIEALSAYKEGIDRPETK